MRRRRPRELITAATLRDRFDRRTAMLAAFQGGIGVLIAARMTYLAVFENERYQLESESNRVNLSLIPPRRGWILDRNDLPLASNRADFRVDVIPERLTDREGAISLLSDVLGLTAADRADLLQRMDEARGFQAVEVAQGLTYDQFAAISVRLPELDGVVPQRGFSRYFPTGPSVGHLLGYVGPASREDYEKERNPLLVTPGFKIGKDGLEKVFEQRLRGVPGARRVEVTASGRIVRDLSTREDVQGAPVKLTIDGPLQDYAARRIGLESGSVVVMDCRTGDLLCMASMPSFDPNSFSAGIGRIEYAMLRENERVPLRNKVLQGLYPPGSTVKPMVSMAFLEQGLRPEQTVFCGGGLRVGNRVFRCWKRGGHGQVDMAKGVYQSCDVYFYHFAQAIGMDPISAMARRYGMGEKFDLPVTTQFYGTVPDPAWKLRRFKQPWQPFDTVNATIGQGYMLSNPLQLAVMAARLATSEMVMPRLEYSDTVPRFAPMGVSEQDKMYIRQAMSDVVNGPGTAGRGRLPLDNVLMAGKTGTAQVVGLNISDGRSGPWKYRDHGLFIFFAPFDKPIYAGAVVIEHGGGSGAAYPIARDVMTYLFDPQKGMDALLALEKQWGGTAQERLAAQYRAYAAAAGQSVPAPRVHAAAAVDPVSAESRLPAPPAGTTMPAPTGSAAAAAGSAAAGLVEEP
ncbi:penicillin-binding protein 2 [Erythrobacteraceae bacterium CFH 75059]|uniref:penicillin-binding protein 2 n=1 Tax=Qipengyuania thermophila TaxID=2509361 RepID=UPI00101F9346|nr:penicillin-binding protein 2 [Qipengyuania thermophila]TCD05535.1 penicillin-binding protein 2 [Erythrobacteraceae bacterium CFH 75059]